MFPERVEKLVLVLFRVSPRKGKTAAHATAGRCGRPWMQAAPASATCIAT
jgi:hypothetical protein